MSVKDDSNIEKSIDAEDAQNRNRKNEEKLCRIFWQVRTNFNSINSSDIDSL